MFLYLAERGRYWLRTMVMTWAALICLGAMSPAVSMAADPLSDWSQSNTNKELFAPWINDKASGSAKALPWDGNWKAFNSTLSERAGGTCALNESDQTALQTFMAGAQADWKMIQSHNNAGDKAFATTSQMTKKFRDALKYRLGSSPDGKMDSSKKLSDQDKGRMSKLFTPNTINSISDGDSLQALITTAPDFAACTQMHDLAGDFMHNVLPNPIVLFKEPARFIVQLIAFVPTTIALAVYSLTSWAAFGLILSTPHSERGDTIFNSFSATAARGATSASKLRSLVGSSGQTNSAVSNQKTCNTSAKKYTDTDAELGFACQNLNQSNQGSNTWIGIANGLRATLSAIYGVIVIGVALIYLFKRNAQSQYNLKVVMPRLFFAVLLSVTAPYLIGTVISISNFILQSILSVQQGSIPSELARSVLGVMNIKLGGGFGGIVDSLISIMVPMCILVFFAFCLLYFIFIGIAKQIALIALIIMTPVACLSFVFRDSGKNLLALWAKGIAGIAALPIAVAGVLVLGIQVANVFWNPSDTGWAFALDTGGSQKVTAGFLTGADSAMDALSKLLAVAVLCVAMTMSMKMVGKLRQWVTGSKTGMVGKGLGTAVKIGGLAAGTAATLGGNPAMGQMLTQATGAAGNRMRNGGGDGKKWLPNSAGTFGSATATPGKDLTSSASRALGSFSKIKQMDRVADAAENKGKEPASNDNEEAGSGAAVGAVASSESLTETITKADGSTSRKEITTTASSAAVAAGSSSSSSSSSSRPQGDVSKGFGEMRRLASGHSQKATALVGRLPGVSHLKRAVTDEEHGGLSRFGLAAAGALGPVGGVIAYKKSKAIKTRVAEQKQAVEQAQAEQKQAVEKAQAEQKQDVEQAQEEQKEHFGSDLF